jgi:Tfp pilus assembly protein PilX
MGTTCAGVVQITSPADVTVCSNGLTPSTVTLTSGGWTEAVNGKSVGFAYTPNGLSTSGTDPYFQVPMLYVAYLNGTYDKESGTQTNNYRIEAAGYGGTANTVAVVESTYQAQITYTTQTSAYKFYSLTGP